MKGKRGTEPGYVQLWESGELRGRVECAVQGMATCNACPRRCGADRLHGEYGVCNTSRYARVASFSPHHGEEDCLRGWNGSGTIFFSGCNLRCVFCQNHDISQQGAGEEVEPEVVALMMLRLQEYGCHNINWVTPEHVVPQVLEALCIAIERGLRLPIVYNTSAYDSLESLQLMDGIVDIYMPDFKFWSPGRAGRYLGAKDYPEVARAALKEMHRQVGDLVLDPDGLAVRGLLVRHLVMPGAEDDTASIMRFLASEISEDTFINVMDQYRPQWKVNRERFSELDRPITREELRAAYAAAKGAGLHRFDSRKRMPLRWNL